MSAHRFQSTWRSLIFNRVYDDSGITDDPQHLVPAYQDSDFRLESFDITSVHTSDYREVRQMLEGSDPAEAFENLRIIDGRGIILGSSVGDLEDKTWAMYEAFSVAACRLAFAANDPQGLGPFDFKRATLGGGGTPIPLRLYCRPGAGRPVVIGRAREGLSRRYAFRLYAFDPFAYSQTVTSVALADRSGGANTVTNPGNLYARPKIVIVMSGAGQASVTLTNTTTGQSVTFNLSGLVAGTYTIDTARSTITDGGGASYYSAVTSGFLNNLYLLAGANTITWSVGTAVTSVTFQFRAPYA